MDNIGRDIGGFMKLNTPFTILNKKFNEMDLIRHVMKSIETSATKRLLDDYRKIFKSYPLFISTNKHVLLVNDMFDLIDRF